MNLKSHLNKLGLIPKSKSNVRFQAENKQELVLALTNYFTALDQLDFFQISKNIIESQFSEDSQQLKSKLKLHHFDEESFPQQDLSRASPKLAFDRLYCQGGINSLKKVILKQKALQQLDKQCTFAPKINLKKTQKLI